MNTNNVREPQPGNQTFVLIVFIMFSIISFLCLMGNLVGWRMKRRRRRQEAIARALLLANHQAARAAINQQLEDASLRPKVLKVLFPPQQANDRSHLVYDPELKRYQWTNDLVRDATCSICLESFESTEAVVSSKCCHSYHYDCIIGWLEIKNECAYCRQPMWCQEVFDKVKQDLGSVRNQEFSKIVMSPFYRCEERSDGSDTTGDESSN